MSESVQLANPSPRPAHAGRAAHGDRGSGRGFDAELDNLDAQPNPAGPDDRGIAKDGGPTGGETAFLARLFGLGRKLGETRQAEEGQAGGIPPFRAHLSAPDESRHLRDEKPGEEETAAPVIAMHLLDGPPAQTRAADGRGPDGGGRNGGNGASHVHVKGDATHGSGKDGAATGLADAAEPVERKYAAGDKEPEPGKDDGGGRRDPGALAKVRVLGVQTVSAPAMPPAQLPCPTVAALARSIHSGLAADPSAQAAMAAAEKPPAPVSSLRIQLQPETLGTVTARLQLSGGSLHVELQVDNADAHHRLKSDSDTIVKSLRALGYDVERVTIQAPAPAQPAASGHNAAAQGREQSFPQETGSGGNGQGSSHAGSGGEQRQGGSHHTAERHEQPSSSGGIYI